MSQDIELYAEKIAALRGQLVAAKARLADASPPEAATIRREIAIAEAMLPFMSKAVGVLKLLQR